ncbi:phosphopantetheine-binding protein [Streptomyces xanthophaeus]|uniref:acyl carrier protein n=1 Tax=Streptomyces xanthophaeus TaxID=67385 RepID=UPI003868443A|nr:phosphopantetheine-binding protein [Streptomyces xanthophaeus]WST63809.1 phosphopantetheine-binding protein [Streptomyces xanthophaeus]
MTTPDPELLAVIRRHLPELTEDTEITEDSPLAELGLDSMRAVDVLFDIEDTFGVSLPDTALRPDTFNSLGGLRAALEQARVSA